MLSNSPLINFFSLLGIIAFVTLISCTKTEDQNDVSNCDEFILVDQNKYENGAADHHFINKVNFEDGCLCIEFSAGGCSGESWEIELLDADEILYSDPAQRNIRLSLTDNEDCEALITKEICFDLKAIQLEDKNTIMLNLEGYSAQIEYNY